MHVGVVTEGCAYPPEVNGVALTLDRLVPGWPDRRHTVSLVHRRCPGHDEDIHGDAGWRPLIAGAPLPGSPGVRSGWPARGLSAGAAAVPPVTVAQSAGPGPRPLEEPDGTA